MDVSAFAYDKEEPMYDVIPPLRALALRTQDPGLVLTKLLKNFLRSF
jgi:hypothetical protein